MTDAKLNIDDKTRTELEAAAFRRLLNHLRERPQVQNIDMMNLAGFCRNCLSNWLKDAADERGLGLGKEDLRDLRLRHALRGVEDAKPDARRPPSRWRNSPRARPRRASTASKRCGRNFSASMNSGDSAGGFLDPGGAVAQVCWQKRAGPALPDRIDTHGFRHRQRQSPARLP